MELLADGRDSEHESMQTLRLDEEESVSQQGSDTDSATPEIETVYVKEEPHVDEEQQEENAVGKLCVYADGGGDVFAPSSLP